MGRTRTALLPTPEGKKRCLNHKANCFVLLTWPHRSCSEKLEQMRALKLSKKTARALLERREATDLAAALAPSSPARPPNPPIPPRPTSFSPSDIPLFPSTSAAQLPATPSRPPLAPAPRQSLGAAPPSPRPPPDPVELQCPSVDNLLSRIATLTSNQTAPPLSLHGTAVCLAGLAQNTHAEQFKTLREMKVLLFKACGWNFKYALHVQPYELNSN